jgi:hypothetical protein
MTDDLIAFFVFCISCMHDNLNLNWGIDDVECTDASSW